MSAWLELRNVSKHYGGLRAVANLSLSFDPDEVTALIGPNGAGKTTVFAMIAGSVKPSGGRILFDGRDITGLRPDQVCRLGIARTFQVVRPFWHLTVRDHLRAAAAFGCRRQTGSVDVEALLATTGLAAHADRPARTLTLALCKRLEIARALATGARLLLLDETMAGLTLEETREAVGLIRRLRERGLRMLLVEHVLAAVVDLCDRAVVLDYGEVIADGRPGEVLASPAVRRAYLGEP